MKRPYYAHTPRNIYGESLVGWGNGVQYTLRSVDSGKRDISELGTNFAEAKAKVEERNAQHETEMAYAHGI